MDRQIQSCSIQINTSGISSEFINKFVQKCQFYYTFSDQNIPLVAVTSVVSLLTEQVCGVNDVLVNLYPFTLLGYLLYIDQDQIDKRVYIKGPRFSGKDWYYLQAQAAVSLS